MLDHIPVSYTERLDKSTDTLYIAIRPGNHVRAMKGKTMLLREYLANEDLTQAQFASRIGVSRSTVSSWMRGLKAPRPEHVMRIRYITNHEVTFGGLLGIYWPECSDAQKQYQTQAAEASKAAPHVNEPSA